MTTFSEEVIRRAQAWDKVRTRELERRLAENVDSSKPNDAAFMAWMQGMIQQYPPAWYRTPDEGVVHESLFTLCLRRMDGGMDDWKRWVKLSTETGGY